MKGAWKRENGNHPQMGFTKHNYLIVLIFWFPQKIVSGQIPIEGGGG